MGLMYFAEELVNLNIDSVKYPKLNNKKENRNIV